MNGVIDPNAIAIVGMACRFPQSRDLAQYWDNLANARPCIRFFSEEELAASGVPAALYRDPRYVPASGCLDDIAGFDPEFFDYSPREASLIDPQQRIFLEEAWKALEDAACDPETYQGAIGVYAGAGLNGYLLHNLQSRRELVEESGGYPIMVASDKDFLATRVSYKLNLRGPGVTVQTACSTSLVAVHMACQALRSGECDLALAGGVSIQIPHRTGYLYRDGMILSADGHCRAFDEKAGGTVPGSGAGVVALKLLSEALESCDRIYAIIKGSAINNDGALKAGYTAPGLEGQAAVIREALALAGVEPDSVTYVETHGTGTALGDPIEIAALNKAFAQARSREASCAIGSVKTAIGHLDAAAGVAGLIKTALALAHKTLPASLNFRTPNPRIDFKNGPFYVNTETRPWESPGRPRRAGVSSFGIGGTNAHAILEEAPEFPSAPREAVPGPRIWILSAKSEAALDRRREDLAAHLQSHHGLEPDDTVLTLASGRKAFAHRMAFVADTHEEAVDLWLQKPPLTVFTGKSETDRREITFLFPGQGSQHVDMGRGLYESEPQFRETVDRCLSRVLSTTGSDLKPLLYPPHGADPIRLQRLLEDTRHVQPLLFIVEYALARLLVSWGVVPAALAGHSLGEYAAACLSGVLGWEDALDLVTERSRLMAELPPGAMLAVGLSEDEILNLLPPGLSLAAVNAPAQCVVSGPAATIEVFGTLLEKKGLMTRRLSTSHAFHSSMMDPILSDFRRKVATLSLSAPRIPYVSSLTGNWISEAQATDPDYWVDHLRHTVRFSRVAESLLSRPEFLGLEVGPGRVLETLLLRHPARQGAQTALHCLSGASIGAGDLREIRSALAGIWVAGGLKDRRVLCRFLPGAARRISLPVYRFESRSCWVEAGPGSELDSALGSTLGAASGDRSGSEAQGIHLPVFKKVLLPKASAPFRAAKLLVFTNSEPFSSALVKELGGRGHETILVRSGAAYRREFSHSFVLCERTPEDFRLLLSDLTALGGPMDGILYLWGLGEEGGAHRHMANLLTLADLVKALPGSGGLGIRAFFRGLVDLTGLEPVSKDLGSLPSLARSWPRLHPGLGLHLMDIGPNGPEASAREASAAVAAGLSDHTYPGVREELLAVRGRTLWRLEYESASFGSDTSARPLTERSELLFINALDPRDEALARDLVRGAGFAAGIPLSVRQLSDPEVGERFAGRGKGETARRGLLYLPPADSWGRFEKELEEVRGRLEELSIDFVVVVGGFARCGLESCGLEALVRDFASEEPGRWRFVDLDPAPEGMAATLLSRAVLLPPGPDLVIAGTHPHPVIPERAASAEKAPPVSGSGLSFGIRPTLSNPYVAPGTPTEELVVRIWEDILGLRPVGTGDNFFELGGTSLMIAQIVTKVRETHQVDAAAINALYQNPTSKHLADYLDALSLAHAPEAEPAGGDSYEEGQF